MLKKVASTFVIKLLIAILNLVIVIILSQFIGAQGKGEASIIITSITMVLLFCNLIGGSSLVYFVPRCNIFFLFLFSNIWSIIVCGFAYIVIKLFVVIPETFVTPIILLSLINSLLATNLTIILGKEKIMSYNLISLLQTVINLSVLWLLIESFHQVNIYAYINSLYAAMGLCLVVSTIYILPYLKINSFAENKKLLAELVKLGVLNQAGHIMKFMSFRISYYVLVIYSGESVLGVFSNGISLIESLLIISNSFAAILYPKISNTTDKTYSQKLTLKMTKMSIIISVVALIPLILFPSAFWVKLFGNEFAGVQKVIWLLAPGIIFYNVVLIIGHYFSGIGKYMVNTLGSFIGLMVTVVFSLSVIPKYGIFEAGIISSIAYIVTALLTMIYFIKDANIKLIELFPTYNDFRWLRQQVKTLFLRNE